MTRKIINRFVKFNSRGEPVYAMGEEIIDDRDSGGGMTTTNQQLVFECPSCGQLQETHAIRTSCELCGVCCDWCHDMKMKLDEIEFRQQVLIERERMNRWQSPALDRIPWIKWIRWWQNENSMERLEETRQRLLRKRNGKRRLLR
jgi:hypothetical protein